MSEIKAQRRAEILDTALTITGESGLDALSMRGLAARIGVTPMALYRYFRDKDDVLHGMVGRMLSEIDLPDPALPWRERLSAMVRAVRAVAARHPAAFPLLLTRPAVTVEALRVVEALYAVLLEAGVPQVRVVRAEQVLSTMVLGLALSEVSGRFYSPDDEARRPERLDPAEFPAHHLLGALPDGRTGPGEDIDEAAALDALIGAFRSPATP
jgi:AcrR family transcriptional regulator